MGRKPTLWLALLAALPVVLAFVLFGSTEVDDAHITYWAASRLAEEGRVLSYGGEVLEQSSSLLHVLVLGVLHAITDAPLPTLSLVVGLASASGLVILSGLAAERLRAGSGLAAGAIVAVSTPVVSWAVGGLETVLAGLCLLGMLAVWVRTWIEDQEGAAGRMGWLVLGTAPYLMVRPEAPFVALATLASVLVATVAAGGLTREVRRWLLEATSVVVILSGFLVSIRLLVFGFPLPFPAMTKSGELPVARGINYLANRLLPLPAVPLLLLGAVGLLVLTFIRRRPLALGPTVYASGAAAVLAFVVAAGGDWMPGPRLLVPALAPAAVATVVLAGPRRRLVASGIVTLELAGMLMFAATASVGTPLWHHDTVATVADQLADRELSWPERHSRIHLRDVPATTALDEIIEAILARNDHRPVTVASHQAGMNPFHLLNRYGDDVAFIDLANLSGNAFEECNHLLVETIFGRVMLWEDWFENLDSCGHETPDVVTDVGTIESLGAAADRYRLVYRSVGSITVPGAFLDGAAVEGSQFIAVRPELLDGMKPIVVNFDRQLREPIRPLSSLNP